MVLKLIKLVEEELALVLLLAAFLDLRVDILAMDRAAVVGAHREVVIAVAVVKPGVDTPATLVEVSRSRQDLRQAHLVDIRLVELRVRRCLHLNLLSCLWG